MYYNKTASLLVASLEFGAIIANLSEEKRKVLCDFGKNLGIAYQIVDDIIDYNTSKYDRSRSYR